MNIYDGPEWTNSERGDGFGRRRGVEHREGAFGWRDVFHGRHRRLFAFSRNAPPRDVLRFAQLDRMVLEPNT
jgi:hypothetical protein